VGTVYRARHLALDRCVALKVLRKQHNERWVSRQRFEREGRALGQLSHAHIVAVTDYGIDGDVPFLVMELLEGESLETRLRAGSLSPGVACEYALQLLEGLAFVHERGLVHRDIKPGNVFLERTESGTERVKLLDFGLAKLVISNGDASITKSGEVSGTPAYMSPEQMSGEPSDARTDVYATGLLLFEMLAGRRAFVGNESEVLRQQLLEALPLLGSVRADLPRVDSLDAILQRATHKEKAQRFADARAMKSALAGVALELAVAERHPSRSARPRAGGDRRITQRTASRGVSRVGRLLRALAVLVCILAVLAIVVAGAVIYLLDGPEGASRRVSLQRALSALFHE